MGGKREMPAWVLPVVVVFGVLLIGFIVWRGLTGSSDSAGPPREVKPGMYDFRKEAEKGNIGRRPGGEGGQTP